MWERRPRSKSRRDSLADEFRHGVDDRLLLLDRELAVDRDGEAFGGRALRVGKRAGAVPEIGETRLQMKRHRIVDLVADTLLVEMALQAVAIGGSYDELVIDVPALRGFNGKGDALEQTGLAEEACVA